MDSLHMLPEVVSYVPNSKEKSIEQSISNLSAARVIAKKEKEEANKKATNESVNEEYVNRGATPESNMRNVNVKELMEEIDDIIYDPTNPALLIWGAPGIGKTEIVKTVLDKYEGERRVIDVQTSQMVPDDWTLPVIAKDEIAQAFLEATIKSEAANYGIEYEDFLKDPRNPKYDEYRKKVDLLKNPQEYLKAVDLPKSWLPVYIPTGNSDEDKRRNDAANGPDGLGGIIFLDELSRADESVQATCLKLVGERQIGGAILGDKWTIIAAANREEDDPDSGLAWSTALGNRFQNVNFFPEYKEWRDWAKGKLYPYIVEFLDFKNQQWFYTLRDDAAKNAVFASPRTWARASQAIMSLYKKEKERTGREPSVQRIGSKIANLLGDDVSKEFIEFLYVIKSWSKKEIEKIIKDADHAKLPRKLGPVKYSPQEFVAVLSLLRGLLKGHKLTAEEWENFTKYLARLNDMTLARVGLSFILEDHEYIHDELGEEDPRTGKMTPDTYKKGLENLFDAYEISAEDLTDLNAADLLNDYGNLPDDTTSTEVGSGKKPNLKK